MDSFCQLDFSSGFSFHHLEMAASRASSSWGFSFPMDCDPASMDFFCHSDLTNDLRYFFFGVTPAPYLASKASFFAIESRVKDFLRATHKLNYLDYVDRLNCV